MSYYPPALLRLIDALSKLPGVGPKSAQRLAFHILDQGAEESDALAQAVYELPRKVHFCPRCFNIAEAELCPLCTDPSRDASKICVVESARDIVPIEKSGCYRGLYHVLGGVISPMEGIGPKELRVKELIQRLEGAEAGSEVEELIFATSANVEGEATALYLADLLKPLVKIISRLASGLPVGGDLEYIDELTLARAMQGRREL